MTSVAAIPSAPRVIRAALVSCLVMLTGCAGPAYAAAPQQAPPLAVGQARVWFLRQLLPGTAFHAPMIYANGAPVASSAQGTAFYRDFAPGNYVFSIENCKVEPQTSQTVALGPGTQTALQVQSDENGYWDCYPSQISYLRPVPPQTMAYLFGQVTYLGAK